MESETQKVLSTEFHQFFETFRKANLQNWDNATSILALAHWITIENGYEFLIPPNSRLDYASNQIKTNEDGSRVGTYTYVHKQTGLKKILELREANATGNKLISLVWKDNKREEVSLTFYDQSLVIHLFVKNLNGNSPMETYGISHIWMLTTMINVGLISERHKKKAYIMTATAATQNKNEKNYLRKLMFDNSDWSVPTALEYLDRSWELVDPTSPLRFIALHIHKVLVNYESDLKLCMQDEGPTQAKHYLQLNGKRILEAFYASTESSMVGKLRITETETEGTGGGVTIDFRSQTIIIDENEYVRNGELDWENLWKLSAKIRVHLICELSNDKLNELLFSHLNVDTLEKKSFVRDLLVQFKTTLVSWPDQLLQVESTGAVKESIIFKIFHAECIISEDRFGVYELLKEAWGLESFGAFHVVAVCIHLALITHPERLKLATTIGDDNVERIVACSWFQENNALRVIEAEYQIPGSGIRKKLFLMEGGKDQMFCAGFGKSWIPFYVPDLVKGYEWIENVDNAWNRWELTHEVNKVIAELDSQNREGCVAQ